MLVAFEGIDGAGKSTQAKLLHRWLSKQGRAVLTEWNSSKYIAPATKKAKQKRALTPVTYSLFHAADFADRHERIIRPAVADGAHVICDRYLHTPLTRDVVRGCDPDWVRCLYGFALRPEITFYIRIPAEHALARKDRKPNWYEAGRDVLPRCDAFEAFCVYQQRIIDRYEEMLPDFTVIDGTLSVKKQQRAIHAAVLQRIGQFAEIRCFAHSR